MLKVVQRWIDRYLSDEEAISLLLILVAIMLVIMLLGQVLAPFLTAVVIAYLLQGGMNYCKRRGLGHLSATVVMFLLFMTVMFTLLLIILPATWNQFIQFISEVPRMASKGQELMLLLPEQYPELVSVEQVRQWTKDIGDEVASMGQFAVSFSLSGIAGLMGVLIYCVLVPILVFFLLKDSSQILKIGRASCRERV